MQLDSVTACMHSRVRVYILWESHKVNFRAELLSLDTLLYDRPPLTHIGHLSSALGDKLVLNFAPPPVGSPLYPSLPSAVSLSVKHPNRTHTLKMEDTTMVEEEDTKRFDINGGNEEDNQPDPDEPLMMDAGNGRVWLVKIPRHLMERWSAIDEEGIPLATIRVYPHAESQSGKKPRIMLLLPANPELGTEAEEYEMDMVNDDVENQIVVAEREKEPGVQSRARTTILTGRVKHECNLRPMLTDRYRQRLKMRNLSANQPKRQIRMIDEALPGGRGSINMLTSGAAQHTPFSLVRPKAKPAKGQFERMARMPRDQLLDELFRAFQERERWSIKALRERTQQPEAYLKEVLSEIAFLHRSGEFNGNWELLANYKGEGIKAEDVPGPSGVKVEDIKMEGDEDDEDDDDDDDDDMEEVS